MVYYLEELGMFASCIIEINKLLSVICLAQVEFYWEISYHVSTITTLQVLLIVSSLGSSAHVIRHTHLYSTTNNANKMVSLSIQYCHKLYDL